MPDLPPGLVAGPPPDATLKDVHRRESGGRNLPPEANYAYPRSHASGVDQFEPGTWAMATKATGIGRSYKEAYQAPVEVQDINAEWLKQKYGVNSSVGWKASAPSGGYKDRALPEGWVAGPMPTLPAGLAAGNAPAAPRASGPLDPSILARQKQPTGPALGTPQGEPLGMPKGEPEAGTPPPPANEASIAARQHVSNGLAQNAVNWVSSKLPSLDQVKKFQLADVIGNVMDKGLNATHGAIVRILKQPLPGLAPGVGMDDTQANKIARDLITETMRRGGGEVKAVAEAPKPAVAGEAGRQITVHPAAPPHIQEGAAIRDAIMPQSAGAAATPTHEILAQNVQAREATMAASDPTIRQQMRAAGNALKSITAPETARNVETGEQTGQEAAASIQKFKGRNQQQQDIAAQGLNKYYSTFNNVTPEEGLTVLRWLQQPGTRGAGGYEPTPEVSGFMKTFGDEMMKVQRQLESLPKTENMEFKKNFVSQMWQYPNETMGKLMGNAPKGGSGYFTKKSVWDSYEDGIRQGGIPLTTNPLEIGIRYLENAYKWIGENQILDEGADTGRIVWRNPGSENVPQGWIPLKGRAENYKGIGQKAYAPPEYAQVYNNYVSTLPQGAGGDLLRGIQRAANITTMAKLSLSWFHAGLMANESMASGFANAIDNIAGGRIATGIAKTVEAPIYPLTSLWRGKQAVESYLDPSAGSIKTQKAVKALVDANFRMRGKGNIADEYRATFLPDFFTSWKKGRLGIEARQGLANIQAHPVLGPGRAVVNTVLRGMETFTAPIFQYMVPRLKTGAAVDMMMTYMRKMPNATDEELAAYARRVSNIIDDRFGEMNQDNIFLHKLQKTVMQSALVSYSYTYGSLRSGIGAGIDTANIARGGWTPRMSYPIGLAMSMAISASIYQYLMTGKSPQSGQDIRNPQTGGVDPQTGQPARAVLPSQLNQVFSAINDPAGELSNKVNDMWKTIYGLAQTMSPTGGYDYKNDPIVDKNAPGIDQLAQAGYFAMQNFNPIYLSQQRQPGSTIPEYQRYFGVRDASRAATDPEGHRQALRYVNAEKAVTKKQHDGDLPRYLPHYMKKKYIQQELNRYPQ